MNTSTLPREKKKTASPQELRNWADRAQMLFIEAFTHCSASLCQQVVFHGGTSLSLSWRSPRFSEDLDFLIHEDKMEVLDKLIQKKIKQRLKKTLCAADPDFSVEIKDATKASRPTLKTYDIVVTHPLRYGKALVKAEFLQVTTDYLANYESVFAYPLKEDDVVSTISQPVKAATLTAAMADKMTALATRPALKWRDLFDIWWIAQQQDLSPADVASDFLHHIKAFKPVDGLSPPAALDKFVNFLKKNPEDLWVTSQQDLRRWLPPVVWEKLFPDGVRQIIAEVTLFADAVATEAHTLYPENSFSESPSP